MKRKTQKYMILDGRVSAEKNLVLLFITFLVNMYSEKITFLFFMGVGWEICHKLICLVFFSVFLNLSLTKILVSDINNEF